MPKVAHPLLRARVTDAANGAIRSGNGTDFPSKQLSPLSFFAFLCRPIAAVLCRVAFPVPPHVLLRGQRRRRQRRSAALTHGLTSDVLEEAERVGVLMPEELSDDDVGEGADEVHEAPVGGVVQPVVPRRRVVALELARRRVAEDDHLQEKRREPGLYHGPCAVMLPCPRHGAKKARERLGRGLPFFERPSEEWSIHPSLRTSEGEDGVDHAKNLRQGPSPRVWRGRQRIQVSWPTSIKAYGGLFASLGQESGRAESLSFNHTECLFVRRPMDEALPAAFDGVRPSRASSKTQSGLNYGLHQGHCS